MMRNFQLLLKVRKHEYFYNSNKSDLDVPGSILRDDGIF